jgi:hypothetical protein
MGLLPLEDPRGINHHKCKEEDVGWPEIQVLHADSAGERT